jgi:protein subunit release factor A
MEKECQRVSILSKKDLEISYYIGSGKGGQKKQKTHSGVQIVHPESGAIGRCSDSRSQEQNKKHAFERLMATPKMKFWLTKKIYEIRQQESLEETVEKETAPDKIKHEIKIDGKWVEVGPEYFDTQDAKKEV